MKKQFSLLAALIALLSVSSAFGAASGDRNNRAFSKADKNGDGKISKEEFTSAAKDASKAEKAFARRDKNHDGFLSKEEFGMGTTDKKDDDSSKTEKRRKKDK